MTTKLWIDWTRCEGRGLLPEVLVGDDWGYPLSANHDGSLDVPARARRYAGEAVKECPRLALRLEKS